MVTTLPTIYLTAKKPAWQEKLKNVLTASAAIEAGVLTSLLTGGNVLAGAKVAGATGLGLGILKSSAKARKAVVEIPSKILSGQTGEFIGGQIEGFGKAPKKTIKEQISEGWEGAGLKGAALGAVSGIVGKIKEKPVVAAAIGAGSLAAATQIPAVKDTITEWWAKRQLKKDEEEAAQASKLAEEQKAAAQLAGLKQVGFTDPVPVGLGGMPVATSSGIATSGAPQSTNGTKPLYNIIQIAIK